MGVLLQTRLICTADQLLKVINYELMEGNAAWRFVVVLVVVLLGMAAAQILRFVMGRYVARAEKEPATAVVAMLFKCLAKPISVILFAVTLLLCRAILVFGDEGISVTIALWWVKIAKAVAAIAVTYAIYRLVEIVEHYLLRWTGKTKTKLDDMLVPVIRKSLRTTIVIIAALWIADGILGAEIKAILLSAGVGGIAIALAAKDTIANFFASITIFADRPFHIGDLVRVGEHYGPVEEVGFRSTRIRTLEGHLVTIPNSIIANSAVENVGKRPYIRRTSNITITYDCGHAKAQRAVVIIKEILADVPELNTDADRPTRVYFSDFNDWSLNIYVSYWVRPANYWLYHEVNERVNIEIMKRFEAEQIEFAFPSQTLYVKKD